LTQGRKNAKPQALPSGPRGTGLFAIAEKSAYKVWFDIVEVLLQQAKAGEIRHLP
jgi:hypothetical protein